LLRQREQDAKPIARSKPERLLETLHRLEENHLVEVQANNAYEAWRAVRAAGGVSGQKLGMPPKPFTASPVPEGVMNKTDHDSRMMRTEGQPTVQGYNAQAAVTRGQIILAAEITVESPDFGHLDGARNLPALRGHEGARVPRRTERRRETQVWRWLSDKPSRCTDLTTAIFVDLVRAAQPARAAPPRPK